MVTLKRRITAHGSLLTAILFLAASATFAQTVSLPGVGSPLGKVTFSTPCPYGSGVGVGIAFDGTNLWYSCYDTKLTTNPNDLYKADPKTGAVLLSYDVNGGLGALAYDAARNVIWAGEGGGSASAIGVVIKIPLDANKNVSGPYQVAFPVPQAYDSPLATVGTTEDIVDGLAIDDLANVLYIHYNFANEIAKYDANTGAFLGFIPEAPGIASGKPVMTNPPVPYCVVSGLAIGGETLYEGADYCDQVWAVDKTTQAQVFDFGFESTVGSSFDNKGMTCDTTTFSPQDAIWVRGAYSPAEAFAFSLPPGSCGNGGQTVTALPPL